MSSLLERLWYNIKDALGKKTYAESQKKKYKDVIDEINDQLEDTEYLDEQMRLLRLDHDIMECNPNSASGKLNTTFVTKEAENRQALETLYNDFSTAISSVKTQLAAAQTEYQYWCSEVEREDREMKVYEQQYYEELEREKKEQEESA